MHLWIIDNDYVSVYVDTLNPTRHTTVNKIKLMN